tara:strand:- start:16 stop:405 length:390 start_codon:yes stop_codon:yes gene_type:complete
MRKVYLYTFFAIIAISINIYSQYLVFTLYIAEHAIYAAILIGTTLGLTSKYLLDKIYIFKYKINTLYDYGKNFAAYISTGFFTTLIFWVFEYSFYIYFENDIAKYIGAIIGLTIGYTVKYILDKKFVFK